MKLFGYVFLAFALVHVSLAGAQDTRKFELRTSDEKLNQLYQEILRRLPAEEQPKLRKAQRAWITFRDLDCKWAFGAEQLDCMIDRTENRLRELDQTVFFDSTGAYQRAKDKLK